MEKRLVAYFSATGKTKNAALALSKATGADLFEIEPTDKYTSADLDWTDNASRSSVEMRDANARPKIASVCNRLSDYDIIYLGFPVWWYTAPRIINTFLESGDFSGKKIILFATSGGSGLGNTAESLMTSCPGAEVKNGRVLRGSESEGELRAWAELMET